jgi:probable phosphoglycerate mutase
MQLAGSLSYALRLLASGQSVGKVWREAGFRSRKELAEKIFDLAERLTEDGAGKAAEQNLGLVVYSDGASIGNPGEAGCGAVVVDESGQTLLENYSYLGRTTNNVAEYEGAILAVEKARELGATRVELRVDSSLLANQINGRYRVKSRQLAPLYQRLMKIVQQFDRFEVTLIGRKENKQADRLANLAISARKGG